MSYDYYPYALVFDTDTKGRLLRGTERITNHYNLLKHCGLIEWFEKSTRDIVTQTLVMGRIRPYEELQMILVDQISDLYDGKVSSFPLEVLPEMRVTAFKTAMQVPGWRIFILKGGMNDRVSGIAAPRFRKMLRDKSDLICEITQVAVINQEADK